MAVHVAKSFETEVEKAFRFLVAELCLSGPSTGGPSAVVYAGDDVCYQVLFDPATRAVTTRVTKALGAARKCGQHEEGGHDHLSPCDGHTAINRPPGFKMR